MTSISCDYCHVPERIKTLENKIMVVQRDVVALMADQRQTDSRMTEMLGVIGKELSEVGTFAVELGRECKRRSKR
jgi:hypothetical protein